MKIVELKICITDIGDALTLGQNTIVSSIIGQAKDLVAGGCVVTIERRYENAPPDHLVINPAIINPNVLIFRP